MTLKAGGNPTGRGAGPCGHGRDREHEYRPGDRSAARVDLLLKARKVTDLIYLVDRRRAPSRRSGVNVSERPEMRRAACKGSAECKTMELEGMAGLSIAILGSAGQWNFASMRTAMALGSNDL